MQPVREMVRELASASAAVAGGGGFWSGGGAATYTATAAMDGAAEGCGGHGDLPETRPLAMRDFEWALGAVQPVTSAALE
jgi:hypothetical protein